MYILPKDVSLSAALRGYEIRTHLLLEERIGHKDASRSLVTVDAMTDHERQRVSGNVKFDGPTQT